MKCDKCRGEEFKKNGTKIYKGVRRQKYTCKGCGADIKGEIIEYLTKGKVQPSAPEPEIRNEEKPESKPNLNKLLHKI